MNGRKNGRNGLTPRIQAPIHWPPTADGGETDRKPTEMDRIDIQNFIDTLAKIALSVARREQPEE
jgi:hypothetical protein